MADTKIRSSRQLVIDQNLDLANKRIINIAEPVNASDAVTKSYADGIASGVHVMNAVMHATTPATGAIDLAAPQTGRSGEVDGLITIDGVQVSEGDRVLVKNQNGLLAHLDNGVYIAHATGGWIRATDYDDMPSGTNEVHAGDFFFVQEGLVNADTGWILTTNEPLHIGETALQFTQFSGAGVVEGGLGLFKNGNAIQIGDGTRTVDTAKDGIIASSNDIAVGVDGSTIEISANGTLRVKSAGITSSQIAQSAVSGYNIASATISGSHIVQSTISSYNILDATIVGADIALATISGGNISSATITGSNIALATISSGNLIPNFFDDVSGPGLSQGSSGVIGVNVDGTTIVISADVLKVGVISGSNIAQSTISGYNIAPATIVGGNIASSTIVGGNILDATITGGKIALETISGGNIAQSTISSYNILDATIIGADVASQTITGTSGLPGDGNIALATIHGDNIRLATISGGNIALSTISSANIMTGTISANNMAVSSITTQSIADGAVSFAKLGSDVFDDIAGAGLTQVSAGKIDVNVDGTTLEINADTLRVKSGGITQDMIGAEVGTSGLSYALINSNTEYEVSRGTAAGRIVIPSTYDDGINGVKPVTAIAISGFASTTVVSEIVIPKSITNIKNTAFRINSGLTTITLPKNLTTIGDGVFSGSNITSLTIPESVTSIGTGVFDANNSLKLVEFLSRTPPTIGVNCFINIPAGLIVKVPTVAAYELYINVSGLSQVRDRLFADITTKTGDLNAITAKATMVDADVILINDSEDSYRTKKVLRGTLASNTTPVREKLIQDSGDDVVFVLSFTPVNYFGLQIFLNGMLQEEGVSEDYQRTGTTITFNGAIKSTDKIVACYSKLTA